MLKAIAFDLWETLITDTPEQSRLQERLRLDRMERILSEGGFATTADRIEHAYRQLWHRCHELYWSVDRDISCRTQIDHFLAELGITLDEPALSALEDAYARAAIDVLPTMVEGAREVLADIKRRGFSIGLISNTGRTPGSTLREVLEHLGLAEYIDAMVFSNEHGVCKPERSIFDSLRTALGVDFSEMMFIGDNPYVDVYGAQRCGMTGVHFLPARRGTAVAPPVDHALEIVPDATIRDLRELPSVIEGVTALTTRTGESR